jgi:hypothetical protein
MAGSIAASRRPASLVGPSLDPSPTRLVMWQNLTGWPDNQLLWISASKGFSIGMILMWLLS